MAGIELRETKDDVLCVTLVMWKMSIILCLCVPDTYNDIRRLYLKQYYYRRPIVFKFIQFR